MVVIGILGGGHTQLRHEKYHGWLGCIGDEILPSCIGIIMNHEIKIPSLTNQDDQWKVRKGFFVAQVAGHTQSIITGVSKNNGYPQILHFKHVFFHSFHGIHFGGSLVILKLQVTVKTAHQRGGSSKRVN